MKSIDRLFLLFIVLSICICPTTVSYANGETDNENKNPKRIIVFPLFAEEELLSIVNPERIVYVGHQYFENGTDYSPTMELTRDIPGREWQMTDSEDLLDFRPDLLITTEEFKEYYGEDGDFCPELFEENVPAVFCRYPENIEDIYWNLTLLGEATGEQGLAYEIVCQTKEDLEKLINNAHTARKDQPIKVLYYNSWQYPFPCIAELLGMESLYTDDYVQLDMAQIAEWNPDFIFFNPILLESDGSILSMDDDYSQIISDFLLNEPSLSEITAVKNGNIFSLHLHSSHFIVKTIEEILNYVESASNLE